MTQFLYSKMLPSLSRLPANKRSTPNSKCLISFFATTEAPPPSASSFHLSRQLTTSAHDAVAWRLGYWLLCFVLVGCIATATERSRAEYSQATTSSLPISSSPRYCSVVPQSLTPLLPAASRPSKDQRPPIPSSMVFWVVHCSRRAVLVTTRPSQSEVLRVLVSARSFSSQGGRRNNKYEALPFSISPEEATNKFNEWASEQGISYLNLSTRIGAAYVPYWTFDVNLRFARSDEQSRRTYNWKPPVFEDAYGPQSVIHVPGLSTYAGHSYRRSLLNPLHNTTLVFLGRDTVPFAQWMLRDMSLSNGATLQIAPDAWNATKGRAFSILRSELDGIAQATASGPVEVQTEIVDTRQVYLPVYVFDYQVLGITYRAFASGCDTGAGISGISHKMWDKPADPEFYRSTGSFLAQAWTAAQTGIRVIGSRNAGVLVVSVLQVVGSILARILVRIPLVGAIVGVAFGFRKVLQPWLRHRRDSAEWERQREHEAYMDDRFDYVDDFKDSAGAARAYFYANRGRILGKLSGTNEHTRGDYDWYAAWEEWARQQWEKQQQAHGQGNNQGSRSQEGYHSGYGHRSEKSRTRSQKGKREFQWDFDPSDP